MVMMSWRSGSSVGAMTKTPSLGQVGRSWRLFVKSLRGLSHTKEEDTPVEDLELSVRALHELTRRTVDWAGEEA
jgi:hypothetical protein